MWFAIGVAVGIIVALGLLALAMDGFFIRLLSREEDEDYRDDD